MPPTNGIGKQKPLKRMNKKMQYKKFLIQLVAYIPR